MSHYYKMIFMIFVIGCGESNYDELNKAVQGGNLEKVKKIISNGMIINEHDGMLDDILAIAIKIEHIEIIQLLIQNGAKYNSSRIQGLIIDSDNIKIIKIFCDWGLSKACFKIENKNGFDIEDIELSNNILLVAKGYSAQVGNMLFISGQIGNVENDYNTIIEGGVQSQVNQAMININNMLNQNDATMEDLLKCTCIMANADDKVRISEIYEEYFNGNKSARITFDEAKLGDGILVEIECVAKIR